MHKSEADRRAVLKSLAGIAALTAAAPALAATPSGASGALRGIYPIAFTPVTPSDVVDFDGLAAQVAFCRRGRVHGIVWPQLASGWSTLTEEDRLKGAEVMIQAAKGGRTKVVIGIQGPDLAAVSRYAAHAEMRGADGVICLPPAGVTDPEALLTYYQAVGRMSSLPLFIQAVGPMSVDLIVRMFETIPTCRYLKDEAGEPLERIKELRSRTGDKLNVFTGRGCRTLITEMELGFVGGMPHVSLADVFASAYDSWHAGQKQEAFRKFGAIQAASTMFSVGDIDVLVARGVLKPGTGMRTQPLAPGASPPSTYFPAQSPPEIHRAVQAYLRPYTRA